MSRTMIKPFFLILFSISILSFSPQSKALIFEADLALGVQTTEPLGGHAGIGFSVSTFLSSDVNILLFGYTELDFYGVEYLNQDVLFKELHAGLGVKYLVGFSLFRFSAGKVRRFYEGLQDSGYRGGIGIGTSLYPVEISINYYKYFNIEKKSVVLNLAYFF